MSTTPKLASEHTRLHRLAGEWLGEGMVYPVGDDRGGRVSSHTIARVSLDGFFVLTDYVEERDGAAPYRGHGVYGWDTQSGAYTMHWFDSMGSFPTTVARGRWSGGGVGSGAGGGEAAGGADAELTFEQRTHQGYARYVYRFAGNDVYLFRIESSRDGRDYRPFMEGKYKRVG